MQSTDGNITPDIIDRYVWKIEREKNWTGINIEKGWKFSIIKIEKIENKYCFFYIFKYSFLLFLIMKNKIYICIYVYMHNLNSKGKIIPFVIIKLNQ